MAWHKLAAWALSRTPQGQLYPGPALSLGGSWSSFISMFPTSVQNLEHWIQRTRKIGLLKICGTQWVCGNDELSFGFSVLGCLLQPNSFVFVQEAPWTTRDAPLIPLPRPSYWKSTSRNFALWARNVINTNVWVNSCGLIILLGTARMKWKRSETEPIGVSILSKLTKI